MVTQELLDTVRRLPYDDQLRIVNTIAETITERPVNLSSQTTAMLDEAISDLEIHPENVVPWSVVVGDLSEYRARVVAKLNA